MNFPILTGALHPWLNTMNFGQLSYRKFSAGNAWNPNRLSPGVRAMRLAILRSLHVRPKDHHSTRKGGAVRRTPELQATLQEAHLGIGLDVVMLPHRVRTDGQEANDRGAGPCRFPGLPDPLSQHQPIRRIRPAHPRPGLLQPIVDGREEPGALRIRRDGAHIQREVKLRVERIEEILRRFPHICGAAPVDELPRLLAALAIGALPGGIAAILAGAPDGPHPPAFRNAFGAQIRYEMHVAVLWADRCMPC